MKDLQIIYLEVDEEIPTIISRLDEVKDKELILVVPKDAILTHSLINLRLLGREAEKKNKKINLVTTDEAGINLSKKAGFAVFESVNDAKAASEVVAEVPKESFKSEITKSGDEVPTEADFESKSLPQEEVAPITEVATPKKESAKTEVRKDFGRRKINFKYLSPKAILILAGSLIVIALLVLAYLYLPSTKVALYVQATSKNSDMNFVLAQNPKSGELTSQILEVDKEKSAQAPATGQKDQGAKASGKVIIYNYWSSDAQVLVADTRFQAISSNQIFRVTNEVTVPGTAVNQGQIVPGTITIDVVADDIGAEYNIAPDRFIIPGLPTDKQAKIYGVSDQPMTGGIKKTVKVVSQEDCDKLLVSIKDELIKQAQSDLANQAKSKKDYIFNTNLIFAQDISTSCDPAVNTETDKLTGKAKVHYIAFLYKDSDLKVILRAQALKGLDPTKDISNDSFSKFDISEKQADLANKKVDLKINTNIIIIPKMDLAAIKNNILGKDRDSAVKYLNALPEVKKVEITFTPTFIKRIPRNSARININIKEAK